MLNLSVPTTQVCSCTATQACIAPWGCIDMKANNSNVGFGVGLGSPYQIDIFTLCSPSNPLASQTYPCNVLSAGVIASVGIGSSGFLILVGLLYLALAQPKISTNKYFEDWTNRVSKLCTNIEKGSFAMALASFRWTFAPGFFFFLILIVVFTLRQRVDLIDGARIGGAFLTCLVLVPGALFIGQIQIPQYINGLIKTAQDHKSLRVSLSNALLGSSGVAFLTMGTSFCAFCGIFLFMTLDRDDPLNNGVFAYGNRCKTPGNGSLCGQTLSLPAACGFAGALSFVALTLRSITGVFAKAAELADELVDRLEPATLDQLTTPAQCLDFVGNLATEAVGQAADCADSFVLPVLAALFLAQGDSARMAVAFWAAGFGLVAALVGKLAASSRDDAGPSFDARHRSLAAGLRAGLYVTCLLSLALNAVTIGILYPRNFPYYVVDSSPELSAILGTDSQARPLALDLSVSRSCSPSRSLPSLSRSLAHS